MTISANRDSLIPKNLHPRKLHSSYRSCGSLPLPYGDPETNQHQPTLPRNLLSNAKAGPPWHASITSISISFLILTAARFSPEPLPTSSQNLTNIYPGGAGRSAQHNTKVSVKPHTLPETHTDLSQILSQTQPDPQGRYSVVDPLETLPFWSRET